MIDELRILELMCARLIHDLAGPVGAVNNSVDFLEEGDEIIKQKALEITKSSSAEAVLRLRFFRQAYGTLSNNEANSDELHALIEEFLAKTRIELDWKNRQATVSMLFAKLMLNFTILATTSLVYGGKLEFLVTEHKLIIKFLSENLIFSDESNLLLMGNSENVIISSLNIQIYYTYMIMKKFNCNLDVSKTSEGIEFIYKL